MAPQQEASGPGPIFIVGPSRSGTSMLREMLNRHPDVWITRETHYFDDLRQRSAPPTTIEDYFLRIGRLAYGADMGTPVGGGSERLRLREEAGALGGSSDAYFEAFCRLRADEQGRLRWGEKTPRHVFRIDEMLSLYPEAKVICMSRDPRAVVASYRDWTRRAELDPGVSSPFAGDRLRARRSYGLLLSGLMCKAALAAGLRGARLHGAERVRLVSFEELVTKPTETLTPLCDWLGLSFDERMLDVPLVQSSYAAESKHGVSPEPAERWHSKLSKAEIGTVEACCRSVMRRLGYERISGWRAWFNLLLALTRLPVDLVRAARSNRSRMGRPLTYIWRRLSLSLSGR